MHSNDFFRTDANTGLSEQFIAAGALCLLSTNSESLLQAARQTFVAVGVSEEPVEISMRFWADDHEATECARPKPYVRGLGHLVFAGFDSHSSLLADLHTCRVIGRFSAGMAADETYWRTIIFPMLLSIVGGSAGLVELHASCVAKDGHGLILAGPSRSGKSTLALALTQRGFRLLSDDRTFCSFRNGEFMAWGLPRPLKLRRESAEWFDELRGQEPTAIQDGERVFHIEQKDRSAAYCKPRMIVFLERRDESVFSIGEMEGNAAKYRMEKELLPEAAEAMERQEGVLEELLSLPPLLLRYGGAPKEIAAQLAESFENWEQFHLAGGQWRAS
ncbi:MAG TPA: hypothetical protein VMT67_05765 [Terriglobales bacterium]|nr:hypothetical protein [Terriglobales bacterium]